MLIRYDSSLHDQNSRHARPTMNVDVSTDVVIDCPLSKVSGYASDPDNVPAWYVNIKSVEWKPARSITVGSRVAFVAQFLGRRMAYTYEIVEFIPGERLVMRTADGPFPTHTPAAAPSNAHLRVLISRAVCSVYQRLSSERRGDSSRETKPRSRANRSRRPEDILSDKPIRRAAEQATTMGVMMVEH